MIYQGTEANTTGEDTQIGTSAFNTLYSNNMYVGYMFQGGQVHGVQNDSTIKRLIDTWYQNNLLGSADDLDENAGFCGDRTTITGNGLETNYTEYAAYDRLIVNKNPSLKCQDNNDNYTIINSITGNKSLNYPIGMISSDEISYAGGVYGISNTNYYLYTGQIAWSMTPQWYSHSGAGLYAKIFYISNDGSLYSYRSNESYDVRPVINLKADIQLSGSGTSTDPYVVV